MEFNCLALNQIASSINEKISISDISTQNYISTENMIVNKAGIEEASKLPNSKKVNFYRKNDILISNIRPYFKKIWQATNDGGASADVLIFRANQDYINEEFLYYFLSQDLFFDFMMQTSKGTKMPRGDKNAIANYKVKFPKNLFYQRRVASIGKTIDDKIKMNKEIIANLEELSQTLFKRWFVDFEFPSDKDISHKSGKTQFVDSLPIGWIRTRADSIYSINIGKTPPRKLRDLFSDHEGEKWVSISDMKEKGPYLFDTKEYLNPKAVKEYRVKVAPENSILLSFKLTIGRVKIAHTDLTTNEAIAHFIQTDKSPSHEYTYLYLKYFNYNELGNTSSIATAVNSKIIKAMPILVPDIKTLTKFQEIISPLFNSIRSYQLQNKNLIELRNTLLPKLISGEIELPDELEVDEHAELLQ